MKIRLFTTLLFAFFGILFIKVADAQSPQKMSYQAVIRDAAGQFLPETEIGVRISVLQGSAGGQAVYVETHTAQTNTNGLATLQIGDGLPVSGSFDEIDWSGGTYFIKSETDPSGGTNYTISGTSELLSVPYALYSEESGTPGPPGPEGPQGEPGEDGVGVENAEVIGDSLYITLTNGILLTAGYVTGPEGPQGLPGVNGEDGIGISNVEVIEDSLYVTLTSGETLTAGYVTGPQGLPGMDGEDGIGISYAEVVGDSLYVTLTTGETLTAGYVTGPQGLPGMDGEDGIGISYAEVIGDSLYVTLTNGETLTAGYVTGPQGPQGVAPNGNSPGDMLFWDGMDWQFLPIGNPGQVLHVNAEGLPHWSGAGYPSVTTDEVTNITPTTATVGGEITSDGGSAVTGRGVVFSTNPFPTFSDSVINAGSGTGTFTIDLTGLEIGQTYYVRAFGINEIGTMFGNQVMFQTNASYAIGDTGPAGGIVFYDKGSYSNGWRYLEAAPVDQSTFPGVSAGWGCNGTLIPGASYYDIGFGLENTNAIVTHCGTPAIAARKASDYSLNGFDDWFLPSNGELHLIYTNLYLNGLGNLNGIATYWSSTQNNSVSAQARNFNSGGGVIHQSKSYQYYHVRAIRRF